MLLLHANEVVSTDALIDAVWGDTPPARARGSLQNYVSHLRKALGEDRLASEGSGYMRRVEPGELDAEVFERLVREAAGTPAKRRAERLRSALALWRGPGTRGPRVRRLHPGRDQGTRRRERHGVRGARGGRPRAGPPRRGRGRARGARRRTSVARAVARTADARALPCRAGRPRHSRSTATGARLLREELGLDPGNNLRALERAILAQDEAARRTTGRIRLERELPAPTVQKGRHRALRRHRRLDAACVHPSTRSCSAHVMSAVLRSAMRAVAERHERNSSRSSSGDEVMVVFGVPTAARGRRSPRRAHCRRDARHARRAEPRTSSATTASRLEIRVGVDTRRGRRRRSGKRHPS